MNLLICSGLLLVLWAADVPAESLTDIAEGYRGPVEQAFQAHCADCHGRMPEGLPEAARKYAGRKAKRAHRRMDIDDGFPFRSKWDTARLMKKIANSVEEGDMPPAKHARKKGRDMTAAEREAITKWARDAATRLAQQ
jgi:mono/diheme cytochrome c family protein